MTARAELTGRKFGKLTALHFHSVRHRNARWLCRCDCGSTAVVAACHLKSGHTRSCGCAYGTHKRSNSPEYRIWIGIVNRCSDPQSESFHRYGGRGIAVAPEWRNDFAAFYAHVGPRPSPDHSIDRIDNERGYVPGNLRWATVREQARNTRRNHYITYAGETLVVTDWAARLGMRPTTLFGRLQRGMPVAAALSCPVGKARGWLLERRQERAS